MAWCSNQKGPRFQMTPMNWLRLQIATNSVLTVLVAIVEMMGKVIYSDIQRAKLHYTVTRYSRQSYRKGVLLGEIHEGTCLASSIPSPPGIVAAKIMLLP